MWRKFLIVGLVLGISMIFLSAPTWAEEMIDEPLPPKDSLADQDEEIFTPCEQVDLEGKWKGLAARSDEEFRNHLGWDDFKVEVEADGTIVDGKYKGFDKVKSDITGGILTLSSDCRITGYILTSDGERLDVRTGSIRRDRLEVVVGSGGEPSDI